MYIVFYCTIFIIVLMRFSFSILLTATIVCLLQWKKKCKKFLLKTNNQPKSYIILNFKKFSKFKFVLSIAESAILSIEDKSDDIWYIDWKIFYSTIFFQHSELPQKPVLGSSCSILFQSCRFFHQHHTNELNTVIQLESYVYESL